MSAITSVETDNPDVVLLIAAHNAAYEHTPAGDVTKYLRNFKRIYTAMLEPADRDDDDEDEETEEEEEE